MVLEELTAFLKLCRKQGVTEITFDGTTVKFGDLPARKRRDLEDESSEPSPDELTEEIMFFSADRQDQ